MSPLLYVRSDRDATALLTDLRADGLQVAEADGSPEAIVKRVDPALDAVLIDGGIEAPVAVARAIHRAAPEAHIIFLTDDRSEPQLRRDLLIAPRIGTHWSVTREPLVRQTVKAVLNAKARREHVRAALNGMNEQLVRAAAAPKRPLASEQFLATILNQLSDGVIVLDGDGNVSSFNAAAQGMFGSMLRRGARGADLFSGAPDVLTDVSSARGTDVVLHADSGEAIFTEIRVTPVLDPSQQRVGTAIVVRDVTYRTRGDLRKQFLAAAAGVFASTLDETAIVQRVAEIAVTHFADICVVDFVTEGRIERRAIAASGENKPIAAELHRFVPPPASNHPSAVAMRTGKIVVENGADATALAKVAIDEGHLDVLRRLGITAYVAVPLVTPRETRGAILLGRSREPFDSDDLATIDELARSTSSSLQNAWLYRAADEANRSKDEFLATVSHELRTPMTSILGWVQLMRIGGLDIDAVQEALGAIEQSARVQAQLIDDLLDLSRIQMGKLHLQVAGVDLPSVVRAAVETVRPAAAAKDINIETRVAPHVGAISGDPNRLQQVFWNLLSNAVKFTGRRGRIVVSVDVNNSKARVRVTDSGQGIDPDFLPFVFERFRQADSSITRRFGGLGLGLSIVKQIAEMHGGTVSADSQGAGKGATFTVLLPLLSVLPRAEGSAPSDQLADLSGIRILIVDDETSAARVVEAVLTQAGATVSTCHSSAGALESIRHRLPDVLISDIAMPDVDGFELIRRVRTVLRVTPERLPAIALTALADVRSRIELLGAGFQRFLRKPVDAGELARTVAEVAKAKRGNP